MIIELTLVYVLCTSISSIDHGRPRPPMPVHEPEKKKPWRYPKKVFA